MTTQQIEQAVSHPVYYTRGTIETWDFISDWRLDFLRGNAIKYLVRAGHKDALEQDLRKALEYLKKLVTNTTYPRETEWADYTPQIDPVAFARDKELDPPLAAAVVMITRWDIAGAIHFVSEVLNRMAEDAKRQKPVAYGTDEERLSDNRNDPRIVEFGKRMGEDR